jgi:hypothetical protein
MLRRAYLFHSLQSFDEPLLRGVPLADRTEAALEVRERAAFFGDRLQVQEEAGRIVVAGGVAARYFRLNVVPDALAPPRDFVQPRSQ